jgi:hypothetical protein
LPGATERRLAVPLSEHEQRILDEIAEQLSADDPKFANSYRNRDLRTHRRRQMVQLGVVVVVGLVLLLAGVVAKNVPLGVAGFVVMLVGASLAGATWQRLAGRRAPGQPATTGRRTPRPAATPRRSIVSRLEDRWERRRDER